MLFSHGSLSFFPTVRYFYTAMNLSANFILSISTSRSIIGWVTFAMGVSAFPGALSYTQILLNLVVSTFGNILGGSVLMALPLYFIYKK